MPDVGASFWDAFQTGRNIRQQDLQYQQELDQQKYAAGMSQATAEADNPSQPPPAATQIDTTSDGGYGTGATSTTGPAASSVANPTPSTTPDLSKPVADPSSLPDPKSKPSSDDVWAGAGTDDGSKSAKPSKLGGVADALKSIGSSDGARQQQAGAIGTAALGTTPPPAPASAPQQAVPTTPTPTPAPAQAPAGQAPLVSLASVQGQNPATQFGTGPTPNPNAPVATAPSGNFQPEPEGAIGAMAPVPNAPTAARGAAIAAGSSPYSNTNGIAPGAPSPAQQPPVALSSVTSPNAPAMQPLPAGGQSVGPASGQTIPADSQTQASAEPSLGAKILSYLNPIGDAEAAPNSRGNPSAIPAAQAQLDSVATPSKPSGVPGYNSYGSQEGPPGGSALPPAKTDDAPVPGSPAAKTNAPAKSAVAGAPATQGATATPGGTTALPAQAAAVAPKQQGPSQQSEAPVAYPKDPIDPRPLAALAKDAPDYYDKLTSIAQKYGVSPDRLAAHWNAESSLAPTAPDHVNADGSVDIGPFQINSKTLPQLDPTGKIDPRTFEGGAELASRYVAAMDARFGKDTFLSVAGYNGGPGGAENIFSGHANPAVMRYASNIFMGRVPSQFQPPMNVSTDQALAAAKQGPEGLIRMLAQTNPGAPMSDKWRSLEAAGIYAALERGDSAGAQQVRDQIFQVQHQGANLAMMGAYQALQSGNGVAAAQYLAKAHAFVPDDAMGRFGVDSKGQVWGEMLSEATGKPTGQAFQVTPAELQNMMIQTRDPNKFNELVNTNRTAQAQAAFYNQHGSYFGDLIKAREDATAERALAARNADAARVAAANARANATLGAAMVRGPSRGGAIGYGAAPDVKMQGVAATELSKPAMTPLINAIPDPQQKAAASVVYSDIRTAGDPNGHPLDPKVAEYYTMGLMRGTYQLRNQGGNAFLTDAQGNQVARMSPHAASIIGGMLRPVGGRQAVPTRQPLNMASSAIPMGRTN